jgi:HEAT repeat protein
LDNGRTQIASAPAGGNQAGTNNGTGAPAGKFVHVETVELLRQLHAGGVEQAEVELRRRGFSDVQLELARQLFDPDPRVRMCLVERLPSLQSVNVVPWLLQLCRDEDSDVRRAAVALIATTGDPVLKAEAVRMARQDADPRLKDQSERIAQQRERIAR